MTEELYNKIKKLKALAEKGCDGEKVNAEVLLAELLSKYNINEEDILEDTIKRHEFQFWGHMGESLFTQVVYMVLGKTDGILAYRSKRNCKTRFIDCTESQSIEIKETFEFYRYHLDEGFKSYYHAFVQVQNMFPSSVESKEMSMEDYLSYIKSDEYKLKNGIKKHDRLLMIED